MRKKCTAVLMSIVLSLCMCAGLCGCLGGCAGKDAYPVEEGYLFGMDYIAFEGVGNGIDYVKAFELMNNLGVKSIRHWMHVTWFLDQDFNVKQENVDLMKDIIREAQKYDFQLIGMSHRNINKYGSEGPRYENAKISRSSDYYEEWIANYERGWYELARLFPEITVWEIDNETNNIDFMMDAEGGSFSLQDMADISTDLFYYGSKGVHAANPEAVTVMGGFVTWSGSGFLTKVYENIKSGEFGEGSTDPDDYFQALAWHPYTTLFSAQRFVQDNQALYDIAYQYEGKHKKVYFTELGGWDQNLSQQQAAQYVGELYQALEELPFVESAHYFRAFDNLNDNNCHYGMFVDPNPQREETEKGKTQRLNPGMPKQSAYAYQEAAGGQGDLELLMTELEE